MFGRSVALVIAVAAGLMASQAPEFAQQYRQRLGGAVDELARVIDSFNKDASSSGVDETAALAVMARNNEPLVRQQAVSMAETILRYHHLSDQQAAFAGSPPFARLVVFFQEFDRPLVESTLQSYEPAVPTTLEGVVLAGGAFLIMYGLLRFLTLFFGPFRHRRRHHHRHAVEQV
jgi:hypothetical protein